MQTNTTATVRNDGWYELQGRTDTEWIATDHPMENHQ